MAVPPDAERHGPPARGAYDGRDLGEGAQRLAVDREDRVVGAQARGLGGLPRQDLAHADEGVNADRADLLGGGGLGAHGDLALLGPAADAQREGRLGAQDDVVLRFLPRRDGLPSIETISSPGARPAFSAGEPTSTAPTIGRS